MRYTLAAVIAGIIFWIAAVPIQGVDAVAPPLQLPWPGGITHRIAGGNSYGCDTHTGVDAYAIDFALSINQPVSAAAAGRVHLVLDVGDGYGNYAWIDHGALRTTLQGVTSLYGHFRTNNPFAVSDGTLVKQGQVIGYADHTGYGTGDHLHFRMTTGGLWGSAYQPEPMSGVSGFGWYGYSVESGLGCSSNARDPSPYWVSRSPLGRDATNDGCSDVFAREGSSPQYMRRYEGTRDASGKCNGGLSSAFVVSPGWYSSYMSPIMGPALINSSSTPSSACADLMARELGGSYRLLTFAGNCSGYYSTSSYTAQGSGWFPWDLDIIMTAGDMNGDGCPDVMARVVPPPNDMRLYAGIKSGSTCTGQLANAVSLGSGWNFNLLAAVGDVTGDGCFDVVAGETSSPYRLLIYSGNCAGGFDYPPQATGSGWHPSFVNPILGPGDMNGDGCGDLLAREVSGGQTLWFYAGHCNATFSNGVGIGSGWSPTALPDLLPR